MKSILSKITIAILSVLFVVVSCKEETPIDTGGESQSTANIDKIIKEQNSRIVQAISTNKVNTTINVEVEDEDGTVLSGTKIRISDKEDITNDGGMAYFENISVYDSYIVIAYQKEGYVSSIKTITPSKEGITNVSIVMKKALPALEFEAKNGGKLESQKVSLEFPSNAIVDSKGNNYDKKVLIDITYFNPSEPNFSISSPGNLTGLDENNEISGLISSGMIKVDLKSASGESLNIKDGKKVKIKMPARAKDLSKIKFWNLNETYGLWVEEGEATKVGEYFEFEVSHFSTYNLDYKIEDTINFCVKFVTNGDIPVANQRIKVAFTDNQVTNQDIVRYFYTDEKGNLCIQRALKTKYDFVFVSPCDYKKLSEIKTIDISESKEYFISLESVEKTVITESETFEIKGILKDCNNNSLKDYYISFYFHDHDFNFLRFMTTSANSNNNPIKLYTDEEGKFFESKTSICKKFLKPKKADIVFVHKKELKVYRQKDIEIDFSKSEANISLSKCNAETQVSFDDYFELNESGIVPKSPVKTIHYMILKDGNRYIAYQPEPYMITKSGNRRDFSGEDFSNFIYYNIKEDFKIVDSGEKYYLVLWTDKGMMMTSFVK